MIISLVLAASKNNVIGAGKQLPWGYGQKSDLKYFRSLTRGKTVIMGRKTFESIGRPLPDRLNLVITRDANYPAEGLKLSDSLEKAIELAESAKSEEAFIIGGGEIFKQALPFADKIYLTRIETDIEGDVFFQELNASEWQLESSKKHPADEENTHPYTFEVYSRN